MSWRKGHSSSIFLKMWAIASIFPKNRKHRGMFRKFLANPHDFPWKSMVFDGFFAGDLKGTKRCRAQTIM